MTALASMTVPAARPTIWGLSPMQIHDRFWACRGVQVVRCGEPSEIVESAELFLLIDPQSLVIFRLRDLVEMLSWLTPTLAVVRLRDRAGSSYKELVESDEDGQLVGFERIYAGHDSRLARVGLTPHVHVAHTWQASSNSVAGWRRLRAKVPVEAREARSMPGRVFDGRRDDQVMEHLECLMATWSHPHATVPRVTKAPSGAWADRTADVAPRASIVGKVWVGAGRTIKPDDLVVGPAILWDRPDARPSNDSVPWQDLEPAPVSTGTLLPTRGGSHAGKRLFDIAFSLVVLALTLPLYPIIALAIWLEDGWPVFFSHRRESRGGREFPCLKFRSMRRDADKIKAQLQAENVADGPQFYVENDPRSTKVGAFLRRTQLDELPQFLNVLVGHMSVVGPRPSPRRENQYCPAWREARLSVRPGVTGLWQVQRTRVEGRDFQEWIQYDLEYVERMSWQLDLWIIWRTIVVMLQRGLGK